MAREASPAHRPDGQPLLSPLWKKAPLALVGFRPAFLAVMAATAIVATTAAAYPLFISSISSAALQIELSGRAAWPAGLEVSSDVGPSTPRVALHLQRRKNRALRTEVGKLSGLKNGLFSRLGSDVLLYRGARTPRASASLPLARDDVLGHVRVLAKVPGGGVWLARSAAESVGARPGDHIFVRLKPRIRESNGHVNFSPLDAPAVKVRVAGIYQELSRARGNEDYWTALRRLFSGTGVNLQPPQRSLPQVGGIIGHPNGRPPKEFMLSTPRLLARIEHGVGGATRLQWNFPLDAHSVTVEGAQVLDRRIGALGAALGNPTTGLGGIFPNAKVESALPGAVSAVSGSVAPGRQAATFISVSGVAIALLICCAAGVFIVQRRRTETVLLLTRGLSPAAIGIKAAAESVLPAALGCALGWLLCTLLTQRLGPSQVLEASARSQSLRLVAAAYVVACLVIGLAAGLSARRQVEVAGATSSLRARIAQQPWELGLLVLAAAAFYELSARGAAPIVSPTGALRIDALTLLFPLLAVAAGAGLWGRAAGRALAALRSAPISLRHPSLYLAARRLSGAPRAGLLLITATTLSAGVLIYAGALSSSTAASERAKARFFVGSDVSVQVSFSPKPPIPLHSFPSPTTYVTEMNNIKVAPFGTIMNVTAIDPSTFPAAAFWEDSFASVPLRDLMSRLEDPSSGKMPVIAVGFDQAPRNGALVFGGTRIPLTTVGDARLWPGMLATEPALITSTQALHRAFHAAHTSLYFPESFFFVRGPARGVLQTLEHSKVRSATVISADEAVRQPAFRTLGWTLGFLNALGVLIGAISLIAALLFGHARQQAREVSYSLARRMGLTRRQHRIALGIEFAGLLTPALIAAACLALLAARLVYQDFDPMPNLPPPSLFRIPTGVMEAAVVGLLAVTLGAAWLLQRLADGVDVAQLMRAVE